MPRLPNSREIVSGWLYDEAILPTGPAVLPDFRGFQIPLGQAGVGIGAKTNVNTNMEGTAGFLSGVKQFVIKSMVVKIGDGNQSDNVLTILDRGFGVLNISDKPYPTPFPIWLIAGGTSVFESVRTSPAAGANIVGSVGPGNIANVLRLHKSLPIPINTLEPFNFTFSWPGGVVLPSLVFPPGFVGLAMWVVLYGFLKRQVA